VSLLRALFACGLYQLLREKHLHAKELFFSVSLYLPPQRLALLSFFCYNVRFEQGNDNDADNNGGGASAD
jgi:hypothetical protein